MSSSSPQAVLLYGADSRTWTYNILITGEALYQLRYIGIWWRIRDLNPSDFLFAREVNTPSISIPHNGGSNGSRTHLYTVTVYYTNRYTMKPIILCLRLVLSHPRDFFMWTFNAYWETLFLLRLYRIVTPTKTL